ncbi:16S rRNA (uracil(1498)-N(3))-methyltransferase [uncultured Hyphomonas sp.]|uniref:16S rRNA (uracil(1498)-N(3))-methyltransferase n=1 Tax=uncultured Hyphomonas sp. TaxID=225298 RepID=UPI002AAA8EE7|nr:16S rRNA (uracil(1498)-N(3))-methyltransferase [uncultured Hyphomonas sp.]
MSSTPRLFVTQDLAEGAAFPLDDAQSNYLLRVLRLGAGAPVRVFNGRDGEWDARIEGVQGKRASIEPVTLMRPQPDIPVSAPILLFAPVKKAETDFIVEKATELGAARITPVLTERTQTRTVRLDRFQKIALEAAEQTERLDLPEVEDLQPLANALDALAQGTIVIFCDERGEDTDAPWGGETGRAGPIAEVLAGLGDRPVAILIGPEGGFSPEERSWLRARDNTAAVSLGPRILRAETAAVAALSVWQSLRGDWR